MADLLAKASNEESWDMIIQPQRNWLDLRLGDLWRYRDLVMLFVRLGHLNRAPHCAS